MGKSFISNLKGLIFEQPEETGMSNQQQEVQVPESKPEVSYDSNGQISGSVDKDMLSVFDKAVDDANIPGPDYAELKKMVNDDRMKKLEPDTTRRWNMAYVQSQISSPELTKDRVLSSIDTYKKVVTDTLNSGLSELNEKKKQNVDEEIEKANKEKEEIDKLQKEIEARTRALTEKQAKIVNTRNEYTLKEANLKATASYILNALDSDKNLLTTILK